jgi:hypothetical protein
VNDSPNPQPKSSKHGTRNGLAALALIGAVVVGDIAIANSHGSTKTATPTASPKVVAVASMDPTNKKIYKVQSELGDCRKGQMNCFQATQDAVNTANGVKQGSDKYLYIQQWCSAHYDEYQGIHLAAAQGKTADGSMTTTINGKVEAVDPNVVATAVKTAQGYCSQAGMLYAPLSDKVLASEAKEKTYWTVTMPALADKQDADAKAEKAQATQADNDAHSRRQQIADDFATVYKMQGLVVEADKAHEAITSDDATTAYSSYKECSDDSMSLSNDEQGDLPDYLKGKNDLTNTELAPQYVALDIHGMCDDGATFANEPTAEHAAKLKASTEDAGLKYGVLIYAYQHAYVAAGGKASDFTQQFPGLPGD